jgi:hypothetical protein
VPLSLLLDDSGNSPLRSRVVSSDIFLNDLDSPSGSASISANLLFGWLAFNGSHFLILVCLRQLLKVLIALSVVATVIWVVVRVDPRDTASLTVPENRRVTEVEAILAVEKVPCVAPSDGNVIIFEFVLFLVLDLSIGTVKHLISESLFELVLNELLLFPTLKY